MHLARQRRIRLAGVFEVAVAALPKRAVVQVIAGQQHGADAVDEAAHGLGRSPLGFTWRPTSSAMTAFVTRGFAPLQLISTRHAAIERYSACSATP